jgi:hypothetical protein
MDPWNDLEQDLAELARSGSAEVHEDGVWLAEFAGWRCEFRRQGKQGLVHVWSGERNLIRRVVGVAERGPGRIILEVQRMGRSKPGRLEIFSAEAPRTAARVTREKFRARFRRLLEQQFPDARIDSITAAADRNHSFSGLYTRGLMTEGSVQWAFVGVSAAENSSAVDGILTYGVLWLAWARLHTRSRVVAGLRIFVPEGKGQALQQRAPGLASSVHVKIFEFSETSSRARLLDESDGGNFESWLTPRRDWERALAGANDFLERVRGRVANTAHAIDAAVAAAGAGEVVARFRGLAFARYRDGRIFYGVDDNLRELRGGAWEPLDDLIRQLDLHRSGLSEELGHPLYRAAPERWLETLVMADPAKLDARLDPRYLYSQVPAVAADRGLLDLLGVTHDGRLVVIELKASEDIHLPLQAVDYWLRVRRHQREGDFPAYGYFPGVALDERPPLLWLVSPGLRFHPTTDAIVAQLAAEIPVTRISLNEKWRRGIRIVHRA